MIKVESIYRYPIKGFPGERLNKCQLKKNIGIHGDRAMALSTGVIPVNKNGAWTPCQAFQRMSIRPDLTTFTLVNEKQGIRLTSANNDQQVINQETIDIGELINDFDDQVELHRAGESRGYWDHRDAEISIINLSTVESISRIVGKSIDPLRFRANIYVRAKPWSEFGWLGQQLAIANTELSIIRPIDRCKTTSVDIETGRSDLNMPALLLRHFGHMFCGVYANVNVSGNITNEDVITVSDHFCDEKVSQAAKLPTAPSLCDWPRPAVITKINNETEVIRSFWIEDGLSRVGSLDSYKAGQYIRVHGLSDDHTWRSYTISEVRKTKFRITVKRDRGAGSRSIHRFVENQQIIITGPFGDATLNNDAKAIYLLSAGIGITPTVAKLQALAKQGCRDSIVVTHIARSGNDLALWDDVINAVKQLSNVVVNLHLTKEEKITLENAYSGRPDLQVIAEGVKQAGADVHICGQAGFVNSLLKALKSLDISDSKIFVDTFSSPDVETELRPIGKSGPIKVTFARSKISEYWNPDDGSLLDFAEARGALISSHCRAGVCKTCRCKIISGSATRLSGEIGDDYVTTLLCSSIPKDSLTLDV